MYAMIHHLNGLNALLAHFNVFRVLTFAFLILSERVSHIGGYNAQSQHFSHVVLPDTHQLAKRMDLETCLGQFDVHNNTIIRTGESQAIGGKYLQGLELDTREECQRLCCETELCDVYIFEYKNGGYCYLFECGPPENFHCKFTRHANYTSAVLTPIKIITTPKPQLPPSTPAPLPPQPSNTIHQQVIPNLSQQEWELTNLKAKPDKLADLASSISSATKSNNQQQQQKQRIGSEMDNGFAQKVVDTTTAQQCSRFQFPCHSGECIAVYNACDGIPQCEDGSDEGPECSGATSNNGVQSNIKANVETSNINSATNQRYRTTQQTSQQQLQNLQQQQSQQTISSPVVNNREDAGAWANRQIVAEAQQHTDGINSGDLNSHIFTHKNGLQLPSGSVSNTGAIDMNVGIANYPNSNANINPIYATNIQRTGIYIPPQQQNEGLYTVPQQQMLDQQGHIYVPANINWAQQQQQQQQQQFPVVVTPITIGNERSPIAQGPAYVINTQQQAIPQYQQQQQQSVVQQTFTSTGQQNQEKLQSTQEKTNVQQTSMVQTNNHNSKGSKKKVLGKLESDHAVAINENENYGDYDDQSTEAPKKKPEKHKKIKTKTTAANVVDKVLPNIAKSDLTDDPVQQSIAQRKQQSQAQPPAPVQDQYRMTHENLVMEFHDHDGQSDRPIGAVLLLTLGLLITAALAILIGCRMRTVGRRARRMGGKFSHEADFLVNGMYL